MEKDGFQWKDPSILTEFYHSRDYQDSNERNYINNFEVYHSTKNVRQILKQEIKPAVTEKFEFDCRGLSVS